MLRRQHPREPLDCLRREAPAAAAAIAAAGGGTPGYGGRVQWFAGGEQCLEPLLRALRGASSRIWLALRCARDGVVWDTVLYALRQRAARGVDVRLILGPGCRFAELGALRHMRIRCIRGDPGPACVLVDGALCFAGPIALRDEWAALRSGRRHHTAPCLRLEGAAAAVFAQAFAIRWHRLTGQTPPALPPPKQSGGYCYAMPMDAGALRRAAATAILRAERSVRLQGRDLRLAPALGMAGRAGVHVASRRAGTTACCIDGTCAILGGPGGGLWLYGDGAAGVEALLASADGRCAGSDTKEELYGSMQASAGDRGAPAGDAAG